MAQEAIKLEVCGIVLGVWLQRGGGVRFLEERPGLSGRT